MIPHYTVVIRNRTTWLSFVSNNGQSAGYTLSLATYF